MSAWWKPLAFGAVVAAIAHVGVIAALPNVIMSVALKRIGQAAGGVNRLMNAPAVTPQNQTIVRPSPDLAYSTCALDVSKGPVRVFIGKGRDYASVAFYRANTDNFFTLNDAKIGPEGAKLLIVGARASSSGNQVQTLPGETLVTLPDDKGLMLVRRLAPNAEAYARVENERKLDSCAAVSPK